MCVEQKEVSNGVMGEGQGWRLSEEDNSRTNDLNRNISNGHTESSQVNDRLQPLHPQPPAPGIRWERFLPVQSLKVLLVENDDSTRHVVGALLRNCSYEVNAVANGLQAWKVLEDPDNRTDLILTEVIMPALSGIGLLCKIMSHKTLKNIPVIMMSSHDSMGIVFKCLSKGAVDFLVKPIRKNELKNLWQHVWRRCHSCSGSVSESGTQSRKSAKLKINEESENDNSGSNEHDNGSTGLSIQDGSDNESGTQNLRADEVDSSQQMSLEGRFTDAPDSICAQVIHTKPEKCSNMWVHFTGQKGCIKQDEQLDGEQFNKGQLECKIENMSGGINVNYTEQKVESRIFDAPFGTSDVSQIKATFDSGESPSLELTLRRSRGANVGNFALDECRTLRHSDLSAFSKYNTVSSTNQTPAGKVGGCSPCENSSVVNSRGAGCNFPSDSNAIPPSQQSNENSNKNDVCSANENVVPKLEAASDKLESLSAFKSSHSSAFRPVRSGCISLAPQVILNKEDDARTEPVQVPITDQRVQVQHHHHHHHHYYHHVHNEQKHQLHKDHDDVSLKNTASATQQPGLSNAFEFPIESQDGNYSQNGSASESNHGSNGQNGSYTAVNAGVTNVESDNGAAGNSGTGDISRGNSSRVDENRIAHREAALTKFRQKRKERCFEKKVRYQSRKKLAEQRPRIRGQFVRQTESDAKAEKDDQDPVDTSCDSGQ